MTKTTPFRRVVIASANCETKFGMTVVMLACYNSHGIQGTNLQLEASVVEGLLNEMVVLDHCKFKLLCRCIWVLLVKFVNIFSSHDKNHNFLFFLSGPCVA